jgi:AGZA family xanthine/uracil permease-like MFS transporter
LGAVFISGIAFLVLTMAGIRQLIVSAIPSELYAAVAVGIGLFIALIGFRNSGLVVVNAATMVGMGSLANPHTQLALFGLMFTATLLAWKVRAAMLIGVLGTTALGIATGLVHWRPQVFNISDLGQTALHLNLSGALRLGLLEIVFVFLFVDMFDNIGTLVGVGKKAGLFNEANRIPRIDQILLSDATATIGGSLLGTSTVVSYIESAAGVVAGGRSGMTAIVTGLLFLLSLFVAPVIGAIPPSATAPALILVGALMISHAREIHWDDPVIAIPAFLTITTIPLTFSIANGLAFGFTAHTLLRILRGEFRKVNWLVYVLTALFLARFIYLAKG